MTFRTLLLALFCALCCTTLAPANDRDFRRELSGAESTEEIQAILATDEWQQLTHKKQINKLNDLCHDTKEASAIEAILDSAIRLGPLNEDEYYRFPMAELFCNEHLSTEEMIRLSKKMLDAGAEMNGETLWMACGSLKKELISFCLENGAQIDDGRSSISPLTFLCFSNPNYLINKLDDDASEAERAAAEVKQIELNQQRKECILYLIEQGANINVKGEESPTPLNFASIWGNIEIMTILLEHGANVNTAPDFGISPLHDACSCYSNLAAVKLLIQHGADIHKRSFYDTTPLMNACLNGQTDVVRYLLEQGADAGAWCHSGDAPTCVVINGIIIPALPTLAYCFMEEEDSSHGESSWHIAGMIFKALSPLQKLSYILCALLLIALPFLVLGLIIWLICRLIRFIKRKKQQS